MKRMKRTISFLVLAPLTALGALNGTGPAAWAATEGLSANQGAVSPDPDGASTVRITFTVMLEGSNAKQCSLKLSRGSDGIAVLQAARDQGCIQSYRTSDSRYPPPGPWHGWTPSRKGHHWLRCINEVCDAHVAPGWAPGTGWAVSWNARGSRPYWRNGLEGYGASQGDTLICDLRGYW